MMRRLALALCALVAVGSCTSCYGRSILEALFGPPSVTMTEVYADDSGSAKVDHSIFDSVLHSAVVPGGLVDYDKLAKVSDKLDQYLAILKGADFDKLSRDGKLAILINAYNAFTLKLILDNMPLESIQDIARNKRWADPRWMLGGRALSLEELENQFLRARFIDPRIHFAINCASISCPALRPEAYVEARIDQQLEDQAVLTHQSARWFHFDAAADTVTLTALYRWYASDFLQVDDAVIQFAARFSKPLANRLTEEGTPKILWLDYDWALNRPK